MVQKLARLSWGSLHLLSRRWMYAVWQGSLEGSWLDEGKFTLNFYFILYMRKQRTSFYRKATNSSTWLPLTSFQSKKFRKFSKVHFQYLLLSSWYSPKFCAVHNCTLKIVLAEAPGKGVRESVSSAKDYPDSHHFEDIKVLCMQFKLFDLPVVWTFYWFPYDDRLTSIWQSYSIFQYVNS